MILPITIALRNIYLGIYLNDSQINTQVTNSILHSFSRHILQLHKPTDFNHTISRKSNIMTLFYNFNHSPTSTRITDIE